MRYLRTVLGLIAALSLSGCHSIAYYTQAAVGQSALLWHSRSIDEVIKDPRTSDHLRERLRFVERIREYAQTRLFLPSTGSYQRFTDIGRDFVLWSVVAAEEFSTEPEVFVIPSQGVWPIRVTSNTQTRSTLPKHWNHGALRRVLARSQPIQRSAGFRIRC